MSINASFLDFCSWSIHLRFAVPRSHRPQNREVIAQTQKDGSQNVLGKWHQETWAQWPQLTRLGGFYCHRWSPAEKRGEFSNRMDEVNESIPQMDSWCVSLTFVEKSDQIKSCETFFFRFFPPMLFIHAKKNQNVCDGAQNRHITRGGVYGTF